MLTTGTSSILYDVIILAAGDFPTHRIPLAIFKRNREGIICCDSAADELLIRGYMPAHVIGDCDSASEAAKILFGDRFIIETEQENNDLTKAVRFAVSLGKKNIAILGATGKREDHTLGNISLLANYMDMANVTMYTDFGCFLPVTGSVSIDCFRGQQVSFFCMDASPLTVDNVKWTLQNRTLTGWWQGTLNRTTGKSIRIETEGKVIIFLKYLK